VALTSKQRLAPDAGYFKPAEWAPHQAVWVAWPWDDTDWQGDLPRAQAELAQLCRAIMAVDEAGQPQGEVVNMLVRNTHDEQAAKVALGPVAAFLRFHHIPTGDLWLRDTAPIFMSHPNGATAATCFKFNGWGGKYLYLDDAFVAKRIATASGAEMFDVPLVLEGGAVEFDDRGTCLTTRQCLLHSKRNPELTEQETEEHLKRSLGVKKVLWLDQGLANDHTDGHIDNLARFVGPATVACMAPQSSADPNHAVLLEISEQLSTFTDVSGDRLSLITLPSPGLIASSDGHPYPASYLNFYIANKTVIVPAFGRDTDEIARERLAVAFPSRRVVSLPALGLLTGGGTFHCITQQQ